MFKNIIFFFIAYIIFNEKGKMHCCLYFNKLSLYKWKMIVLFSNRKSSSVLFYYLKDKVYCIYNTYKETILSI